MFKISFVPYSVVCNLCKKVLLNGAYEHLEPPPPRVKFNFIDGGEFCFTLKTFL